MNIKSLLLGSAAVLIAASTAQAADAIVVEPEPVEYVRICDAYGSGFFYIPGTETCMRISGYIRSTYAHSTTTDGGVEQPDHASWNYRGRLNFDVRNETDWGTLRSQLRLQGGDANGSSDANVGIDRALISVAGFRLGYSDDYWTTGHQYGQGPAVNDGQFDYRQALFFDYTYAVDGFSLTVGVQDHTSVGTRLGIVAAAPAVLPAVDGAEAPDYYVGAKYVGDWGWAAATYIYDQNAATIAGPVGGDAWKVSVEFTNVGDTGWNVGGWYMTDGSDSTSYVSGRFYSDTGARVEDQWGIQANGPIADNLNLYAVYSDADSDGLLATTYLGTTAFAIGLVWTPIVGLEIKPEYFSVENDHTVASNASSDTDGFLVRITRSW